VRTLLCSTVAVELYTIVVKFKKHFDM